VNETFERKFWASGSAIGRRFRFHDNAPWITIVGVVGDVRQAGLNVAPRPEMYLPASQSPYPTDWLAVRTTGDPSRLAGAVRRELRAVDKDLPIRETSSMEEILDREVFSNRAQALLLTVFAALAVLLASIGIYGVLAYTVARRTGEIGLRMALGARPARLVMAVAGEGIGLSAVGIMLGAATALAVTRLLSKLLFGITATDPRTFVSVAGLLLLIAAIASYWPARRAMRIDPILALREE
jgi:predicted lysophospholipase L1 biosynthesis ABC-type transport system permease subunit